MKLRYLLILFSIITTSYAIYETNVFAENFTISIPFGAYDPNLNTPTENWYEPPILSIKSGDTVTWINNDKEAHTVTSGDGPGRFGWTSGKKLGEPNGLFNSDRFMPAEQWSHTFENSGIFHYFCVIHPWMEGAILVDNTIPDYPHDAYGNKIEQFPVIMYTPDNAIEVDLTWEPNVIKTHETTKFIYQFYDKQTGVNLGKMDYDFVLIQNGVEIFNSHGKTTVGGDFRNFVFSESGPILIKFRNIESGGPIAESKTLSSNTENPTARLVDFSTIVYDSSNPISDHVVIQPAQRLDLQYELMIAIIVAPGVLFIYVVYRMKKAPKKNV